MGRLTIALDGPAGSGKSSAAKQIAQNLGILYLDTGAMYRAVGYWMLKQGIDPLDRERVESEMEAVDVLIRFVDGHQQVWVNGEDVTGKIRNPEISKAASDVSAHPVVRMAMVELQRKTSCEYDMILDGRDIGTFVLPDAKYKFFLVASCDERARRRHKELAEKGIEKPLETIKREIEQRDYNDSHRALAPLKQAEDAILIDSTSMTIDEVVDTIIKKVKGEQS
ncbi:MAG: (d)CMP kinase [Eubacteriales bacterium]